MSVGFLICTGICARQTLRVHSSGGNTFCVNDVMAPSWKWDVKSKILLYVNRCIFTWGTFLPNFISIRLETTEPWAFLKTSPQQEQQEQFKTSSAIRPVPDPKTSHDFNARWDWWLIVLELRRDQRVVHAGDIDEDGSSRSQNSINRFSIISDRLHRWYRPTSCVCVCVKLNTRKDNSFYALTNVNETKTAAQLTTRTATALTHFGIFFWIFFWSVYDRTSTNVLWIRNWRMLMHMRRVDAACLLARRQHFSAWQDVMTAILNGGHT